MNFQPRDYQQACHDALVRFLQKCKGDPVIEAATGAGKSWMIAMLCRQLSEWGCRAVILQPSKELLEQNCEKLKTLCPDLSIGIYSASLRSKQRDADFVFATIGSVVNKETELGERQMVIVDEAHAIPAGDGGQYNTFRNQLKALNPKLRMAGFTATPYRLDAGPIVGSGLPFDSLAHRVPVGELLEKGYLTPLKSISVKQVDTSGLRKSGWDYKKAEMQSLFSDNVAASCRETVDVANAQGSKHCLVFSSGVDHADEIKSQIETLTGERVEVVTGETLPLERSQIIADFQSGRLRWLVNVNVLTVGFDSPNVDLIAVMRATLSAGLFAQICGRGLRLHDDKEVCYLLDFGGNVARHGAIDDDDYGRKPKKASEGGSEAVMKSCPACGSLCYAASRECPCGFLFPAPMTNVDSQADSVNSVMNATASKNSGWSPVPVAEVKYFTHRKEGKPDSLRIVYKAASTESQLFAAEYSEWLCIEHEGAARAMAEKKWNSLSLNHCPDTVMEALALADAGALAVPDRIAVKQEGKYWRVKLPKNLKKPPFVELPDVEAPF
jgi:DNA repair protein RadD